MTCVLTSSEADVGDEDLDARCLTILRDASGKRERSFRSALPDFVETAWDDWPVAGPRTFLWCSRHILTHTFHPLEHHSRFRQLASLVVNDPGAVEHEFLMRLIEVAVTYDQLNCSELTVMELIARRAQMS